MTTHDVPSAHLRLVSVWILCIFLLGRGISR